MGPLIRLPEIYRGVQGNAAYTLYRAAAAHAQAHLIYGGARFPVGTLKPLQFALVTLIEDARIELLAMRQLSGLRRLWSPYHVAVPDGVATAPVLLARLARALFDPSYRDDDSFVAKGRWMFEARHPRLDDPAISREVGMLLGNDLGQMRVQFNAKTYVVEPIYRDDGLGLWDFGDQAPSSGEALDLAVEAARIEQRDDPDKTAPPRRSRGSEPKVVGRGLAAHQRGTVIANIPNGIAPTASNVGMDDGAKVRRVRRSPSGGRNPERADILRNRIRRWSAACASASDGLKRQLDGHDLDVDAVLEAGIALRIHRSHRGSLARPPRSIAILRSCCCSTYRNRRAIVSPPARPFSTSNA